MLKWLLSLFLHNKQQQEVSKMSENRPLSNENSFSNSDNANSSKNADMLILTLKRIYSSPTYTIGKLYVDNEYFCDTLEDTVRANGVKVYGKTAIPAGKYDFILTYSPTFKRTLPLLLNVPNFTNIRLHSGNTAEDSEGCILCGENKTKGTVTNSKTTISRLMVILQNAENLSKKFAIEISNDFDISK